MKEQMKLGHLALPMDELFEEAMKMMYQGILSTKGKRLFKDNWK